MPGTLASPWTDLQGAFSYPAPRVQPKARSREPRPRCHTPSSHMSQADPSKHRGPATRQHLILPTSVTRQLRLGAGHGVKELAHRPPAPEWADPQKPDTAPARDQSSQPHRAGMEKLGEDRPPPEKAPSPPGEAREGAKASKVHASGQQGKETWPKPVTAPGDPALAPVTHDRAPLQGHQSPAAIPDLAPPPNLPVVNPPPAPATTKGLSDTWEQPSLCSSGTRPQPSFQNMQTPGQSRGRALGGIPHTAAGCTPGQAPTCLRCAARTRRPGWGAGRGRRRHRSPQVVGRGPGLPNLGHSPRPQRTLRKLPRAAATRPFSQALLAPELWASPPHPAREVKPR